MRISQNLDAVVIFCRTATSRDRYGTNASLRRSFSAISDLLSPNRAPSGLILIFRQAGKRKDGEGETAGEGEASL
jgi:hypothetical protein